MNTNEVQPEKAGADPPSGVQRELEAWRASLPEALVPHYRFLAPNEVVPLYSGPLVCRGSTEPFTGHGTLEIAWRPKPALRYATEAVIPPGLFDVSVQTGRDADLWPADTTLLPPAHTGEWHSIGDPTWAGRLLKLEMGSGRVFSKVTFQLVNFIDYFGAWVRHGDHPYHGRVGMAGEGWQLILDGRPDHDDVEKVLQSDGGYVATHVAQLTRQDGSTFTREEAELVLDGLHWLFSFASGSSCGPFLPVGFDENSVAVWTDWSVPYFSSGPTAGAWLDRHHPTSLAELFPGFIGRWLDPYWRRAVYIGVGYYQQAIVPQTVERAIGLGQIVLELLVHAVLVEGGLETEEGVKPIGVGISRLLAAYKIDASIPANLRDLQAEANRAGWRTGPWAVTAIRNEIIHPKRGAAERPWKVRVEAWRLMLWYVEMTLLAFFGFNGAYNNRLSDDQWVGTVEQVPWAP